MGEKILLCCRAYQVCIENAYMYIDQSSSTFFNTFCRLTTASMCAMILNHDSNPISSALQCEDISEWKILSH